MLTISEAVALVQDAECDDIGTFVELVNSEYGTRYDEEDLSEIWKQTTAEIEGDSPDLPDDIR